MVMVTVSETYDLSTKLDKMSLVGIHTPSSNIIKKSYPGLITNCKWYRLVSCDVKLACASVLPADPSQVGISAGKIAPQDLFNPILYKAISNEGMSQLEYRLHGLASYNSNSPAFNGESVVCEDDFVTGESNDFGVYYSLLSHRDGFKVAHPQRGLEMTGLRPLVFERLYNIGDNQTRNISGNSETITNIKEYSSGGNPLLGIGYTPVCSIRGNGRPMPKMNTTYLTGGYVTDAWSSQAIEENTVSEPLMPNDTNSTSIAQNSVFVAMLVLPPSRQNLLFYRLVVRWHIEFTGIRPIQEILTFHQMSEDAGTFYGSNYETLSKALQLSPGDMVDTKDADIEKIMEGA